MQMFKILLTAKQAVSPGEINWIWPETAFSDTPDSNQFRLNSLHAVFIANLASKLSTQLRTKSTGPFVKLDDLEKNNKTLYTQMAFKLINTYVNIFVKLSKFSTVVIL